VNDEALKRHRQRHRQMPVLTSGRIMSAPLPFRKPPFGQVKPVVDMRLAGNPPRANAAKGRRG
jgi:hypothetical protein